MKIVTWQAMLIYEALISPSYNNWIMANFTSGDVSVVLEGIGNFSTNNDALTLDFDNLRPFDEPNVICSDQLGYAPLENSDVKLSCREAALQQLMLNDHCDTLLSSYCCASW